MSKKVVVEGEVRVRTESKAVMLDRYKETFLLDDSVKDERQALSIIKKGLLDERLRKTVKNYRRYRTHEVVSFESVSDKPEDSELAKLLVEATELQCVPEGLSRYTADGGRKKALEKAIEVKKAKNAKSKKGDAVKDLGKVD